MREALTALLVPQCAELVDEVDETRNFRPFGVRTKDEFGGQFELFATESRRERVNFILAFKFVSSPRASSKLIG